MKKIISIALVLVMLVSAMTMFTSCGDDGVFKLGVICLHDENSTYDKNFLDAVEAARVNMGLSEKQVVVMKNIPESDDCYKAAKKLVNKGCDVIFADSFGHEDFVIKAAKKFPKVQFCHATGTKAHTEGLDNYHNAFASIYEGRFLAGVAGGMKLREMQAEGKAPLVAPKIGYVGAFTYAEVISGYTSYYLGVKSVVEDVVMDVQFTGSWFDVTEEKNAALALINNGCVLISQHADSMGAPSACEEKGVPNVSYNGSTVAACPNTFIVSSRINWTPYFELIIKAVKDGDGTIPTDWCGTIATGSVELTAVNEKAAAEGTAKAIDECKKMISEYGMPIFDTKSFTVTVDGEKNKNATVDADGHLTNYMADVDTDAAFTGDKDVIKEFKKDILGIEFKRNYFSESDFRSAPYFDLQIDGITLVNTKF